MAGKRNCWEFYQCGREPGGDNAKRIGTCPAATEKRLNGVHGGKNAGRACWAIAGTLCEGEPDRIITKKITSCVTQCGFYKQVKQEESSKFVSSHTLLERCGGSIQDLAEL